MTSTDDGLRRSDGPAAPDGRRALVVADGPEAEDWLVRAGRALGLAAPLAIGPAVQPARAAVSARRAQELLDHGLAGGMAGAGSDVVRCDDHEIALLLGDALDDPDERFELALALRVTRD